jgi:hypothetical protein
MESNTESTHVEGALRNSGSALTFGKPVSLSFNLFAGIDRVKTIITIAKHTINTDLNKYLFICPNPFITSTHKYDTGLHRYLQKQRNIILG